MHRHEGQRLLLSFLLALFLWAALCVSGCAHSATVSSPPPCPEWSDEAIDDLAFIQGTGCCPHLESAIGRQVLYCEAVKKTLDD